MGGLLDRGKSTGLTEFPRRVGEQPISDVLHVFPSTIRIDDLEPNTTYRRPFTVKNIDSRPRTAKLLNPSTKAWKLTPSQPTLQLAPGLEAELQVEFTATDERNYFDKIIFQLDDGQFELNLEGIVKQPFVVIDGELHFGEVTTDSPETKTITLRNCGKREASFEVFVDQEAPFQLNQTEGSIPPADEGIDGAVDLEVSVPTSEEGFYASVIEVKINGQVPTHRLEATANVSREIFRLLKVDRDEEMGDVHFGTVFAGDSARISSRLHNHSPYPVRYISDLKKQEGAENMGGLAERDMVDLEDAEEPTSVSISEDEGVIQPHSSKKITFSFFPEARDATKGFLSQQQSQSNVERHSLLARFCFENSHNVLLVPILARSAQPSLIVTDEAIDFGVAKANERVDYRIALNNPCEEAEIPFRIHRAAYFKVSPDSGIIPPGLSKPVFLTYHPKALGKHDQAIKICAMGVGNPKAELFSIHIPVYGEAHGYQSADWRGGIDTLPEEFERKPNYIDSESAKWKRNVTQRQLSRKGTDLLRHPEVLSRFQMINYDENYNYSWDQFVKKTEHRKRYNEHIRQSRLQRNPALHSAKLVPPGDDEKNLGLQQASGLKEPKLRLPEPNEPLYTAPVNEGAVRPKNRPAYLDEEDSKQALRSYRSTPADEHEEAQLRQPLSSQQISSLKIGPAVIDFGRVTCLSQFTRHLLVQNDLNQPIMVDLQTPSLAELGDTYPVSQIVSPQKVAVFAVVLHSAQQATLKKQVPYVINGQHQFHFEVQAEIVPVNFSVSREDIHFAFAPDNFENTVTESLLIHNPNNHSISFWWEGGNSNFALSPMKGTLEKKNSLFVKIVWHPSQRASENNCKFWLNVSGALDAKVISCSAEMQEGRIYPKEKSIDFGSVPIAIEQRHLFTLKNVGSSSSAFFLEKKPEKISIEPTMARIPAGSAQEVDVVFCSAAVGEYSGEIVFSVRGGKPIKVPVQAMVVQPEVSMEPETLDFGSVQLWGSMRRVVTLHNHSSVFAHLGSDFDEIPEFRLELPRENWSSEDYEDPPLHEDTVENGQLSNGSGARASYSRNTEHLSFGVCYAIKVAPFKSLSFLVHYKPQKVVSQWFNFPLKLKGTEQLLENVASVKGRGLEPRLIVSETALEFGERVILREQHRETPYRSEIQLTNNESNRLRWSFGNVEFRKGQGSHMEETFDLNPKHGELGPKEKASVIIKFTPQNICGYQALVPIFVDDEEYVRIELNGKGIRPRIEFSVREVYLPPVPLGIQSEACFYIFNKGYDNLEIGHRLPADTGKLPISLEFPQGQIIGLAKEELKVIIRFSSKRSTSFTTRLTFFDDEGTRFTLPVTAVADNCLLSLVPFVERNVHRMEFKQLENQTPQLLGAEWVMPPYHEREVHSEPKSLVAWLNSAIGKSVISNIPADFINSKGRVFLDLLEHCSGKKPPGRVEKFSQNKREAAEQLLSQYESMLSMLKQQGALVNDVKPELLLSEDELARIISARESKLESRVVRNLQENADAAMEREDIEHWRGLLDGHRFAHASCAAWKTLVLQLVRTYILSRVTPKQLRQLPGFEDVPDSLFVGSNIFSTAEAVLLVWTTRLFRQVFPEHAFAISDFGTPLRNGVPFIALLVHHWPEFWNEFGDRVVLDVEAQHQEINNFEVLLEMMGKLGMEYDTAAESFLDFKPEEFELFLLHLFLVLPSLVPRATVEFKQSLLDQMTRKIELKNPSNRAIVYKAHLAGSRDFTMEESSVRIEPNSTNYLEVTCSPSTSKLQEARVLLSSRKEAGAPASTLVFLLRSIVDIDTPLAMHDVASSTYELTITTLPVANPFPADCEFNVRVEHQPLYQDNQLEESHGKGEQGSFSVSRRDEKKKKAAQEKKRKAAKRLADMQSHHPLPFGPERRTLRIRKGDKTALNVLFLPFVPGESSCYVIFEHPDYGVFKHYLKGEAQLPKPHAGQQKFTVNSEHTSAKQFLLSFANPSLEAARKTFLEKHPGSRDKHQAELARRSPTVTMESYEVAHSCSYIRLPSSVTLTEEGDKTKERRALEVEGSKNDLRDPDALQAGYALPNHMALAVVPKGEGVYTDRVVLQGSSDVRVIDLEFTASRAGQEASLTFRCHARQEVRQDIPLVNNSDRTLMINANLAGTYFSGPGEVSVGPHESKAYPLSFSPAWVGTYEGTLELRIAQTNEHNTYHLHGLVSEPLAESTVTIDTPARSPASSVLPVPNVFGSDKPSVYNVTTDLPVLSGRERHTVPASRTVEYEVTASPLLPGKLSGVVTFQAEGDRYVYYNVTVNATMPEPEAVIEVSTTVREAAWVTIPIDNPSDEDIEFGVQLEGGGLLGSSRLRVPARSTADYSLCYSPLATDEGSEGAVYLTSDSSGLFWFRLRLSAAPAEAIIADFGSVSDWSEPEPIQVHVENPLNERLELNVRGEEGMENFAIQPRKVLAAPFQTAGFTVHFQPFHGEVKHEYGGRFLLESSAAGSWEVHCSAERSEG